MAADDCVFLRCLTWPAYSLSFQYWLVERRILICSCAQTKRQNDYGSLSSQGTKTEITDELLDISASASSNSEMDDSSMAPALQAVIHIHTHVDAHIHIIHTHTYRHIHIYVHTRKHTCMHINVRSWLHVHECIYINRHQPMCRSKSDIRRRVRFQSISDLVLIEL